MLHDNEMINIEEDMILSPGHLTRRFTLHNRISQFRLGITSLGATVVSCKVNHGKEELIRMPDDRHCSSTIESVSSNQRNVATGYEWQSHVLGLDTLLLATSNYHTSSITYQLTADDQLLVMGKLRSLNHLSFFTPFYFNLNSESDNNSGLAGHLLHIQAFSRVSGLTTEFPLCTNNDSPEVDYASYSPQAVRAPSDFQQEYVYIFSVPNTTTDRQTNCVRPQDVCIVATLSFGAKLLKVRLHNNSPPSCPPQNQTNNSQISSTTSYSASSCSSTSSSSSSSSSSSTSSASFRPISWFPSASESSASASASASLSTVSFTPRSSAGYRSASGPLRGLSQPKISSFVPASSSSSATVACASSSNNSPTSSNICSSSSSSFASSSPSSSQTSASVAPSNVAHLTSSTSSTTTNSMTGPGQICKLRVGITRFGVSLLPSQMNEFKCVYKFSY